MLQSLTSLIEVEEISLDQAKDIVTDNGIDSAVGHSDTAAVFTEQLGVEVPVNRATITLEKGCWPVQRSEASRRLYQPS